MKLHKFIREDTRQISPLYYPSFERKTVIDRLSNLASFYDEIDDLFDEYEDTTDGFKQYLITYKIKTTISEACCTILHLNIDDVLFTTQRTKINGAKLFIEKSTNFMDCDIHLKNYRFFISYMRKFYTRCQLVLFETYTFDEAFRTNTFFNN